MGLAYLILYGVYAFCVTLILILLFLLFKKGFVKTGSTAAIMVLLVGVYPAVTSTLEGNARATQAATLSFAPDSIDFTDKTVLFVESESSICGQDICAYGLRYGNLKTAYWTPITSPLGDDYEYASWPFDLIKDNGPFYRLGLINLEVDGPGFSLPDPVETLNTLPQVDYTVVADDSFFIHAYENQLGLAGKLPDSIRFSYMVYEGWPTPGQEPIARLLTVQYHTKPPFTWPVSTQFHYNPPLFTHRDQVRAWFCPTLLNSPFLDTEDCPKLAPQSSLP